MPSEIIEIRPPKCRIKRSGKFLNIEEGENKTGLNESCRFCRADMVL